jgi:hypothetical protein
LALRPTSSDPAAPKVNDREAAAQDGFLREVDEALREEQLVNSFKRFGVPVGSAIVAGLLALAGYWWWDSSVKSVADGQSERTILAMDRIEAGALDAGAKDLQGLSAEGSAGTRAAALMQLAAIAAKQGKSDDAARQFAAIAADPKIPQPYRDLATVREVTLRYDKLKPEEVIARLRPLAVPGKPFFGSAGELVGMAYLDQGKPDLAGALFAQIGKDTTVPASLRARMRQLAGGLGFDAGVDLPEDEPEGGAAASAPAPAQQ